jgi:hypothetical protein
MYLLQCFDVSSLHIYVLNHYYLVMFALSEHISWLHHALSGLFAGTSL